MAKKIKRPGHDPRCNICGTPAVYDAPTVHGPWAYLCRHCAPAHTTPDRLAIGFTWEVDE